MGLDIRTAEFLLGCRALGVDFSATLTLGRQTVKLSGAETAWIQSATGVNLAREEYADAFFAHLGGSAPESMDASAYEGATILHNLNQPPPPELLVRFSCVIDGGTLEHIFDFPGALASCLRMVRPGGHFITCTAANNLMGHGFYQFSPELYWSAFSAANGLAVEAMVLHAEGGWYAVANPGTIGARVQASTRSETFLFVLAKKLSELPLFVTPPHQSDYVSNLGVADAAPMAQATSAKDKLIAAIPGLRGLQECWRAMKHRRECSLRNRRAFRPLGKHLPARFGFAER